MKSWKILALALVALLALLGPAALSIAAPPVPSVVEQRAITGYATNKLPIAATGNGRIYVSWGVNEAANFAERQEEAGEFSYETLGSVGSSSTYFNTAVAVAGDGTVHYAWSQGGSTIWHRSKPVGGSWSGNHLVAGG